MGSSVTVIPDCVGDLGESVGPVDFGCVRRYRHRRLATYLFLHGFRDTLRGLLDETDAYMSVIHLSRFVRQGLWDDAIAYVSRFLRPVSHPQSDEAQVLLHFLKHHAAFASMVAGVPDRNLNYFNLKYNTRYLQHDASASPDAIRIRSIVLSILHSEKVRASLDWECVRWKASQIVKHLAYKAPELKDVALLPCGPMMPHDVLPIGFRYRRRRHVKEQDLPGPKTLAKIYLRTRKRLPSLTRSHKLNSGLTDKTRKWFVDLIDESLQAGLEPQSSGKEGVPGGPVSNTISGTATHLTKNSGTSSLTNAGAPVAPVSQTMFGTLTTCAEVSGISSVTNPGAPASSVLQTVKLTGSAQNTGIAPVTNAAPGYLLPFLTAGFVGGAPVAPVPQSMFGVPGATVLHTMSDTLTNAGAPVPPVSQTMSGTLTVPANISGAPVATVSQTLNLTSHAENAGISAVTNAGTNNVLSSENSNLGKHPRTEQTTFEQGPRPKMQRPSGAFGEACLASVTKAGGFSQADIVLEDPKHEVEQA